MIIIYFQLEELLPLRTEKWLNVVATIFSRAVRKKLKSSIADQNERFRNNINIIEDKFKETLDIYITTMVDALEKTTFFSEDTLMESHLKAKESSGEKVIIQILNILLTFPFLNSLFFYIASNSSLNRIILVMEHIYHIFGLCSTAIEINLIMLATFFF